ncbi:hypothetical protein [Alkalihalobacterium bogoriense]|uniref:hypothetical protein n=1 Tax=Alkalihalobacterium bogoriense TaxID=246272 RepID=UPI00047EF792|nr:hypothetical protein [Alkalihalobacterium bogoriense]
MIDFQFEQYSEVVFTDFSLVDNYDVYPWSHYVVSFTSDKLPMSMEDPTALLIVNKEKDVLQIVLQEEGCDSPNFQFTELEKQQITTWFHDFLTKKGE